MFNNRLDPFQGWRLTFFQGVIFAIFIIFSLRMYQMQIVDNTGAQIAADENRLSQLPLPADRGVIFDRNDNILASNVPAYRVIIIPAELPGDREEELAIFNQLSALTGVPATAALADASGSNLRSIEELVIEGLGFAPFQPVVVADDVDLDVALRILEEKLNLPGVDIQEAAVRRYGDEDRPNAAGARQECRNMHIEPGVVDAAKMGLAFATAAGAIGYTAKLSWNEVPSGLSNEMKPYH